MAKRTKLELGGAKYYSPNPNKKTGDPATLQPGTTVANLTYMETTAATKSKFANRVNHKFLEAGQPVIFNGSGMLDSIISQLLVPGDVVDITYKGQAPCPFGQFKGRPTHEYEIFRVEQEETTEEDSAVDTDDTF